MTSRAQRGSGGSEIIRKQELGGASLWTGARSLRRGHPGLALDVWKEDGSRAADARAPRSGARGTRAGRRVALFLRQLSGLLLPPRWRNLTEPPEIYCAEFQSWPHRAAYGSVDLEKIRA